MKDELVTSSQAARYLKTTRNTVYRWCRDGTLPAIKVGGVWRVPVSALDLREHVPERKIQRDWPDVMDLLAGEDGSHWLIITQSREDLYNVDASLISKGLAAGYRVVKGSWWQSPDEIRAVLSGRGLDVTSAELAGALVLMDMPKFYAMGQAEAVMERWQEMLDGARKLGYRGIWKVGTPCLDDLAPIEGVMKVERAAEHFFHGNGVRAICPIYTADTHPGWHSRLTEMLAWHDVVVYYSEERCVVLRSAA